MANLNTICQIAFLEAGRGEPIILIEEAVTSYNSDKNKSQVSAGCTNAFCRENGPSRRAATSAGFAEERRLGDRYQHCGG
jgi:hypothetical protein